MAMSKKDRIAIVVSVIWVIIIVLCSMIYSYGNVKVFIEYLFIYILLPLTIYWGTRFIKGNISFLNQDDKS